MSSTITFLQSIALSYDLQIKCTLKVPYFHKLSLFSYQQKQKMHTIFYEFVFLMKRYRSRLIILCGDFDTNNNNKVVALQLCILNKCFLHNTLCYTILRSKTISRKKDNFETWFLSDFSCHNHCFEELDIVYNEKKTFPKISIK